MRETTNATVVGETQANLISNTPRLHQGMHNLQKESLILFPSLIPFNSYQISSKRTPWQQIKASFHSFSFSCFTRAQSQIYLKMSQLDRLLPTWPSVPAAIPLSRHDLAP